jgi:hypothetical protein
MDENGTVQINYQRFVLPIWLLSAAFFGIDILIILGLLELVLGILVPALAWLLFLVFMLVTWILIVSPLIGSVQFLRELKAQSLPWRAVLPLCVLSGVMMLATICYYVLPLFFHITDTTLQIDCAVLFLCAFMSLPAGLAYALRDFGGTESAAIRSFASATGIFGLAISGLLLFLMIITSWMSGLESGYLVVLFLGLFHGIILMPMLGVKIFRLGQKFAKMPPTAIEVGGTAGPAPQKKIEEILREVPRSISPRVKWTILIIIIILLVVAGCYMVWDITDTTPGRKWTEVTKSAPFGSRTGFTSAEYQGKLWIIGGSGNAGTDGDAWYTSDGITWNRVSSADMVPQHLGASSAVFRDALWVIGGSDEQTYTPGNGIWYSGNGINWSEIQPKTVFPARSWHSTVVFRDRIWIIGGNRGTIHDDLTNDVWYSDDGISWVQATPAAGFSPRSDHSSFVYQDKIWVIGGCDSTGYLNDVWYSGDGIHWAKVPASAPFATDTSFHAVVFDNRMWVLKTSYEQRADSPWGTETSQGIWYSYDGITWTKVRDTPEFFEGEYNRGQPLPIMFDNRLFVLQQRGMNTGIWYTKPEGQAP